jgi:hypothetical protein
MADDEWISYDVVLPKMRDFDPERLAKMRDFDREGPQIGLARLRSAIKRHIIRVQGRSATTPNGRAEEIADKDLEGLIFEPPDRLIRPRSANAPATGVYIDIRFLASSVDSWLEEVRARQERANLQVAESRFDELRWLLEWALAWIAFRTKEGAPS